MRRAMVVGLVAIAATVATGCATTKEAEQNPVAEIKKFTRADIQRGYDIAFAAQDSAGVNCSAALLAVMPEDATLSLEPTGAYSGYMKIRELHRGIQGGGVPESVHIACAPLVVDAEQTMIRLGLIAAPGGGAIRAILPR